MSSYVISPYSKMKARKLKVRILPSMNPKKKIDVFKNGVKVASIGDVQYNDFPKYVALIGIEGANKRREAYHARHSHEPEIKNGLYTPSYYAKNILW